jgi:cytosine/adenosine deaminase-related metal-dependent hydrolase
VPRLKIERARYVLTVDPSRRIIADGTIVVDGQRISHVGTTAELASMPAERTIDASACVVTPALINAHIHISYAHAVSGIFPDDFVGMERLREVFRLQSMMTAEEEYATSLLALTELVKTGTVTLVDPGTTKHLDACLDAYAAAGCRIVTGAQVADTEAAVERYLPRYETTDALRRTASVIEQYHGRLDGRVHVWAMPFSPDFCTPELLAGCKRIADELGTRLTFHHASGPRLRELYATRPGGSPTGYVAAIGVLGPNVLVAHAPGIDIAEVDLIAQSGASVVICPSTTQKEGQGVRNRPLRALLDRGVAVAQGNDSANSSNYLDGVRTMNANAVAYKDAYEDARQVPAEEALEIATLSGARAVGMADQIGSIEVGKRADLVLFDTRRAEWSALLNPVNNLVYSADGHSVDTVVADGRVVVEHGRAVFVDEARLCDQVQHLGEALLERVGPPPQPRSRWPITR